MPFVTAAGSSLFSMPQRRRPLRFGFIFGRGASGNVCGVWNVDWKLVRFSREEAGWFGRAAEVAGTCSKGRQR